jgi:hypothetical protein
VNAIQSRPDSFRTSSGFTHATWRCLPAGVGTARAIANAYSVFASGGRELGLRQEMLDLLAAPATPPARGFCYECMKTDGVQFSLGFMKPTTLWPFGSPSSFGSPGSGGSLGFADPVCWRRLCLRHKPDGDTIKGRPAG